MTEMRREWEAKGKPSNIVSSVGQLACSWAPGTEGLPLVSFYLVLDPASRVPLPSGAPLGHGAIAQAFK